MGYSDAIGPGGPDLDAVVAAQRSRLVAAQQYIAHSWPDGNPQQDAALFGRIADWITNGGPLPWDPTPTPAATYPPEDVTPTRGAESR